MISEQRDGCKLDDLIVVNVVKWAKERVDDLFQTSNCEMLDRLDAITSAESSCLDYIKQGLLEEYQNYCVEFSYEVREVLNLFKSFDSDIKEEILRFTRGTTYRDKLTMFHSFSDEMSLDANKINVMIIDSLELSIERATFNLKPSIIKKIISNAALFLKRKITYVFVRDYGIAFTNLRKKYGHRPVNVLLEIFSESVTDRYPTMYITLFDVCSKKDAFVDEMERFLNYIPLYTQTLRDSINNRSRSKLFNSTPVLNLNTAQWLIAPRSKLFNSTPVLNSPEDITDELIEAIADNKLDSLTINYEFTRDYIYDGRVIYTNKKWVEEQYRTNPFWRANSVTPLKRIEFEVKFGPG